MAIEFVNIKTGARVQLTRPAQITAFINSSDLGVNSNKGQDFGWRLSEDLVNKIEDMRDDGYVLQQISERLHISIDDLTTTHFVQEILHQEEVNARRQVKTAERNSAFKQEYEDNIKKMREKKIEVPVVTPVKKKA